MGDCAGEFKGEPSGEDMGEKEEELAVVWSDMAGAQVTSSGSCVVS